MEYERLRIDPSILPLWNEYTRNWRQCNRCGLAAHRASICHVRGVLPCRVLYIGEAPGDSEDVLGYPFVGPAGKELDRWLTESDAIKIPHACTNVVGCIPYTPGSNSKLPPKKAIKACDPRLSAIVGMASPQVIVVVGNVAESNIPVFKAQGSIEGGMAKPKSIVKIPHPSAALQARGANKAILIQKAMIALEKLAVQFGVRSNAL